MAELIFLLISLYANMVFAQHIPAAGLIADQIKKGMESNAESAISALIAGIEAYNSETVLSSDDLSVYSRLVETKRMYQAQSNLFEAEIWLKTLQNEKNTCFIIPEKLGYSIVREGTGKKLSQDDGKVLLTYTIKKLGDYFADVIEKRKEVSLTEVMPGIVFGMQSMLEGEIRVIYLHPQFGYRSHNYDPNVALEATVELIKILPEKCAPSPFSQPPLPVGKRIKEEDISLLEQRYYFILGWRVWDFLRYGGDLFSKDELIACIKQKETIETDYTDQLNQIYWHLYHQKTAS